jgi:hypothetical protein
VPVKEASRKRPPVSVPTSKPVRCSKDCFAPLTDEELEEWGLG